MSLKSGEGVKTFKDTFWSKKRVEAGITIKELAEGIGVKKSTLCAYLIGVTVPKEPVIRAMCDWFGVDYIEGEREFIKAYRAYDAQTHGKSVVAVANSKKRVVEERVKSVAVNKEVSEVAVGMSEETKRNEITKLVYGKVSQDVYEAVRVVEFDKLLQTVYDKVDYVVYETIRSILNGNYSKAVSFDNKWDI